MARRALIFEGVAQPVNNRTCSTRVDNELTSDVESRDVRSTLFLVSQLVYPQAKSLRNNLLKL